MTKITQQKSSYSLDINDKELSVLVGALYSFLFENTDVVCCNNCRTAGVGLLGKIKVLHDASGKHN